MWWVMSELVHRGDGVIVAKMWCVDWGPQVVGGWGQVWWGGWGKMWWGGWGLGVVH